MAIVFDHDRHKLTAIYEDHSLYVWDVQNVRRVGKNSSFLYHSAKINGLEAVIPHPSSSSLSGTSLLRAANQLDPHYFPEGLRSQIGFSAGEKNTSYTYSVSSAIAGGHHYVLIAKN